MTRRHSRLPEGRSWPISKTSVETALAEAGVPELSKIYQYVPYGPNLQSMRVPKLRDELPQGHVVHVDWEPNSKSLTPWGGGPEHVTVWMRDVPSSQKAAIGIAIADVVLPQLVEWLRKATTSPEGWKVLRHRHAWAWSGDAFWDEERAGLHFRSVK